MCAPMAMSTRCHTCTGAANSKMSEIAGISRQKYRTQFLDDCRWLWDDAFRFYEKGGGGGRGAGAKVATGAAGKSRGQLRRPPPQGNSVVSA
jgi:hypothetical protein